MTKLWDEATVKRLQAKNGAAKALTSPKARKPRQQASGKPKANKKLSAGEETLANQLTALRITGWIREYRFDPKRRWRADFAFPSFALLVEVEGGIWQMGRHQTGTGFAADLEKYNAAVLAHWAVLRYSTEMVMNGTAAREIVEFVEYLG
jgi:very-short-patch-repair endonuclease